MSTSFILGWEYLGAYHFFQEIENVKLEILPEPELWKTMKNIGITNWFFGFSSGDDRRGIFFENIDFYFAVIRCYTMVWGSIIKNMFYEFRLLSL